KYWTSPYKDYGQIGANFYQDALEYVTYLFVLGYDYLDAEGKTSEYAPLFDFEIEYDVNGLVKGMKVNGWENYAISVEDSLGRVKALYQELGSYVGVTDKNKEQLARFIKDEVLGAAAYKQNKFAVSKNDYTTLEGGGVSTIPSKTEFVTFNRNYDKVIENVIAYACTQAPIGVDAEGADGKLTLDKPYLASEISDYVGDYFFMSYEGEDDSNMFQYIESAEYQSMVLYPQDVDINKAIGDLYLAFEYYDDPVPEKNLKFLPELTINVGFRYFDHTVGEYTVDKYCTKKIKYGKNGTIPNTDPDVNWVTMTDTDTINPDIVLGTDVVIKTKFDNMIGGGAINPFVNPLIPDVVIGEEKATMLINGYSNAREYYELNPSSTGYGFYGALNGDMFVGDEGCDFIEVYFDVVKIKGETGWNYNFKVGLLNFLTAESVF
ncbi:MAG: hypothetical protein J6K39_00710, partial [Clostridia bacterium]|nr:hypothetical protein [Clostridia bacterium]